MDWILLLVYSSTLFLTNEGSLTYLYVGCYKDRLWPNRALSVRKDTPSSGLTLESCTNMCRDYSHFGMQYGKECRCGDTSFGEHGEENGCDIPCSGNSRQICGGHWRNSVYAIVTIKKTTTRRTKASATTMPTTTLTMRTAAATSFRNLMSTTSHSRPSFFSVGTSLAIRRTKFRFKSTIKPGSIPRQRTKRSMDVVPQDAYVIIGVSGAAILALIIILVLCISHRRKRHQSQISHRPPSAVNPTYDFLTIQGGAMVEPNSAPENEYCDVVLKSKVSRPVPAKRQQTQQIKEEEPLASGDSDDAHVYCNVSVVSGKRGKEDIVTKPTDKSLVIVENDLYNS